MKLCFNRQTALSLMRKLRTTRTASFAWGKRVNLFTPDPAPRKRWTRKLVNQTLFDFGLATLADGQPIDVAVPHRDARLGMGNAHSTVYGSDQSLPPHSFIEIRPGIAIACPELTFIEMASVLDPARHLLLGHELCGCFSRDAHDPRNGRVTLDCPPVTSCRDIKRYLQCVHWSSNTKLARQTLERLADNAWSPTESIVAAMVSLPVVEGGYELGSCKLNVRVDAPNELKRANAKGSRVPDILFGETPVGLNYDGAVHLDLDAVVRAATELERNPGSAERQQTLDAVVRKVRAKAIDDIRRNRELIASGYIVFPVTKEDLYEDGGLDRVMLQVMNAIEEFTGTNLSEQRRLLFIKLAQRRRQELIWSLMPGHRTRRSALDATASAQQPRVIEVEIGF